MGLSLACESGMTLRRRQLKEWASPFLLPYLGFFTLFIAAPLFIGLILSFFKWDILNPPEFVGIANFSYLLKDAKFWTAVKNTAIFAVTTTPLLIAIPLLFALILNRRFPGRFWAMVALISPYFFPSAAVLLIWDWMLDVKVGMINYYLTKLGFGPQAWLSYPVTAWAVIIGITVWWTSGFNTILYLSALQKIPREHYEAAAIDGAGAWAQFRYVTLPWLRNIIIFICTVQTLTNFMIFDQIYILTSAGPYGSTRTIVYYLYETGFQRFRLGRASAMGWLLFLIVMAVIGAQMFLLRRIQSAEE